MWGTHDESSLVRMTTNVEKRYVAEMAHICRGSMRCEGSLTILTNTDIECGRTCALRQLAEDRYLRFSMGFDALCSSRTSVVPFEHMLDVFSAQARL